MTDNTPAEWALKMAEEHYGKRPSLNKSALVRLLDARFGPVLAAWDAWDCTVPVKSWQRIADAVKEFRTG